RMFTCWLKCFCAGGSARTWYCRFQHSRYTALAIRFAAARYSAALCLSPVAASKSAASRNASTNCSEITEESPFSSCGGMPKLKSFPQSTNGHHGIGPKRPLDLTRGRYQARTLSTPVNWARTKSVSPRYIQKSWTIPTHISENVGIICTSDDGYRLWVSPSGMRELLYA